METKIDPEKLERVFGAAINIVENLPEKTTKEETLLACYALIGTMMEDSGMSVEECGKHLHAIADEIITTLKAHNLEKLN